jgi:2',3'-cyclic-nucleotide 2'-phosphodiesterase (5'-nucleotidase family)
MIKKRVIFLLIGAGLTACSSYVITPANRTTEVAAQLSSNKSMDAYIDPYRDTLKSEMDVVVARADQDFIIARPGSNLTNWVADALFANQTRNVRMSMPVICLLNTGGIRSSINKGNITVGDFYKLMPFDNAVVWAQLPMEALSELEAYLVRSGGEPIANAMMKGGKLELHPRNAQTTHFWVITSDYLLNGGDKMTFFAKRTDTMLKDQLLRDVLMEEAKQQGTLIEDTTLRIKL